MNLYRPLLHCFTLVTGVEKYVPFENKTQSDITEKSLLKIHFAKAKETAYHLLSGHTVLVAIVFKR